jgi:hypothetical protein
MPVLSRKQLLERYPHGVGEINSALDATHAGASKKKKKKDEKLQQLQTLGGLHHLAGHPQKTVKGRNPKTTGVSVTDFNRARAGMRAIASVPANVPPHMRAGAHGVYHPTN